MPLTFDTIFLLHKATHRLCNNTFFGTMEWHHQGKFSFLLEIVITIINFYEFEVNSPQVLSSLSLLLSLLFIQFFEPSPNMFWCRIFDAIAVYGKIIADLTRL